MYHHTFFMYLYLHLFHEYSCWFLWEFVELLWVNDAKCILRINHFQCYCWNSLRNYPSFYLSSPHEIHYFNLPPLPLLTPPPPTPPHLSLCHAFLLILTVSWQRLLYVLPLCYPHSFLCASLIVDPEFSWGPFDFSRKLSRFSPEIVHPLFRPLFIIFCVYAGLSFPGLVWNFLV